DATEPYALIEQDDPKDPKRYQGVIKINAPIPASISLVTGDAVHNLRTAFDHLACAAVSSGGGKVTTDTAFPIWRKPSVPTEQQWYALATRKVKGAPKSFISLLLALQPYERGNHEALWAIDYLDVTDKHKLLIEAFSSYAKLLQWAGPIGLSIKPDVHALPLKDGDELFGGLKANKNRKNDVEIEVALGEPGVLAGEPVVPALTDLLQTATALLDTLRKAL
ncbi:MAG TPA: hypothetical protein VII01_06815, partial [Solirubrobacteraceae bacterium]